MRQTKLISALSTLDVRERERFQSFVRSPFFNQRDILSRLCEVLLEFAPDFDDPELSPQHIFQRIAVGSSAYNELAFNNLSSDLLMLLYKFLHYVGQEGKALDQQLQLTELLLERDLEKHALGTHHKARLLLDATSERSAEYWRMEQQWWITSEKLYSRGARRSLGEHLLHTAGAADLAMVIEKLRIGCVMVVRNKLAVVQGHFTPQWLDTFLSWCQTEPRLLENPMVKTYVKALQLLNLPSQETYFTYIETLEMHLNVIPEEELKDLYQYALNYCIKRINDGHPDSYPQTLKLYQTLLDRDLLVQNGVLSQWTYKNIATTGLRSGEFEWTEQFIRQYRLRLPTDEQQNSYAYNLGTLLFEQKKYGPALHALQSVEFTDFTYHLGVKIIQLKIYYLLNEEEALNALLDATAKLLQRNKSLSDYGKSANLNFIKAVRMMDKSRQSLSRKRGASSQLDMQLLESLQPLANKEWLKEAWQVSMSSSKQ